MGGRASARPRGTVLEHLALRGHRRLDPWPGCRLSASPARMDAPGDRSDPGAIAGFLGGRRLAVFPGLAWASVVLRPAYVGLQLASGFSRSPHRGRAFHSRGCRGARPAWQPRNVHRRKRVRANPASLVFGSGGHDFATPLLLVGFDVVVSLSDARLGALDCRGA